MAREQMIARSLETLGELASTYGESWNPSVARAYDFPAPLPDEAVSSWLVRYAIRKNCSPGKILDGIGVSWQKPIYWLDFDQGALPWDYLGKLTSTPATTLRELVPKNCELLLGPSLLCLHTDPMRMLPHLRYCPLCLRSDAIPYYRASWRLASNWFCQKHRSILRDYCPVCQKPVFWDYGPRNRIRILDLRKCHHCGEDLCSPTREATLPKWLTEEVIATQADFLHVLGFHGLEVDDIDIMIVKNSTISRFQRETHAIETLIHNRFAKKTPTLADASENLTEIVRILDFPSTSGDQGVRIGVGIEANKLFGSATNLIYTAVMQHQNPFGTTLWLPGHNPLKKAQHEAWSLHDFDRAKDWVLRYINRDACSPHKSDK
ncbi:MAG TPA: TniQ family protein [Azonexus sp.]|nr:TniQ family protein [Azonexus sp.]